jgi:hypothetical protein
MSNRCALCSKCSIEDQFQLRSEWIEYLCENRNIHGLPQSLSIPVCGNCKLRLTQLQRWFESKDRYTDGVVTKIIENVHATLDDVSLSAVGLEPA